MILFISNAEDFNLSFAFILYLTKKGLHTWRFWQIPTEKPSVMQKKPGHMSRVKRKPAF